MNHEPSGRGLALEKIQFAQGDFNLEADLELKAGNMACLLGPSGSGKTTILRLVGGFENPGSGKIRVMDRDITSCPPEKRKLGIVFQDYALFPHMNVEDNITYGIRAAGLFNDLERKEKKEKKTLRVQELLDLVQLPGYEKRDIGSLSGGEQQRIALARALAPKPDLLLLDEPLSALDVQLRTLLRREIKRIQETLNLTTLYITHDQEEAMAIADTIFVMKNGRIIESGPPEVLYSKPENLFTGSFLGTSSTVEGSVVRSKEGWRFKCGSQEIILSTEVFGGSLSEGRVRLFFRPEDCLLSSVGKPEKKSLSGNVLQVEYRGSYRFIILEIGGTEVKLFIPPNVNVKKGDLLSFTLAEKKGLLFPV